MDNLINLISTLQKKVSKESVHKLSSDSISQISNDFEIKESVVHHFYKLLKVKATEEKNKVISKTGHRHWCDSEKLMILTYINHASSNKTKTQCLVEISNFLGRTFNATQFLYYNFSNKEDEIQKAIENVDKIYEVIETNFQSDSIKNKTNDDVFDYIKNISENFKTLENENLESLFKSLANLTQLAVGNLSDEKKVNELKETIEIKNNEIFRLKKELSLLTDNFYRLKRVILDFHELDTIDKLSQMKTYNEDLNELIENIEKSSA